MAYFLLHEKGEIKVSGQIDIFNKDVLENDDTRTAVEITKEEYDLICKTQENFSIVNGKIQEKNQKQKDDIKALKDDWATNNTVRGLKTQLADMKIQISDTKTQLSDAKDQLSDAMTQLSTVQKDISMVK